MWQPVQIRFTNLFGHRDSEFHFKQNEMILLLGQINSQTESVDSNGAGKSTIVDAITIAITGNIPRDLNKESIIHYGESHAVVAFLLQHSVTKEVLLIYREINAHKSNELLLHINEKLVTGFDKMKRTAQQWLYEKLGINEADFLNYFVINQGQQSTFITSTDSKQKEVISRFSNYSQIEPIVTHIVEELAIATQKQSALESGIAAAKQNIATVQDLILQLQTDEAYLESKQALVEKIANKKRTLATIDDSIKEVQADIDELKIELKDLKKGATEKLSALELEQKLAEAEQEKRQHDDQLDELHTIESELAVKSGKVIKCPKCKYEFLANDAMTKAELEASKAFVVEEKEKLLGSNRLSIGLIGSLKQRIKVAEGIATVEQKIAAKVARAQQKQEALSDYHAEVKDLEQQLKSLKANNNKGLIKTQQANVAQLQQQVALLEQQLAENTAAIENLKFHHFAFDKQFRTYIANKTIRTIQDVINYYLQSFKIDLRILINGYTVLKNKEIREKIQIYALKDNEQVPIKALSGGERARVAECSVIALNYLICQASPTGAINLLVFDEFLEGLDVSGQNEMIRIMERSGITSLLVAHHVLDSQAKNKVYVQKKGVESSLKGQS